MVNTTIVRGIKQLRLTQEAQDVSHSSHRCFTSDTFQMDEIEAEEFMLKKVSFSRNNLVETETVTCFLTLNTISLKIH